MLLAKNNKIFELETMNPSMFILYLNKKEKSECKFKLLRTTIHEILLYTFVTNRPVTFTFLQVILSMYHLHKVLKRKIVVLRDSCYEVKGYFDTKL